MIVEEQRTFDGTMNGTILLFLTVNKFRVQLSDGQLVDAAMPDDLIEQIRPFYAGAPVVDRIGVMVEFRDPPAMHRIVELRGNGWCGAPRGCWR